MIAWASTGGYWPLHHAEAQRVSLDAARRRLAAERESDGIEGKTRENTWSYVAPMQECRCRCRCRRKHQCSCISSLGLERQETREETSKKVGSIRSWQRERQRTAGSRSTPMHPCPLSAVRCPLSLSACPSLIGETPVSFLRVDERRLSPSLPPSRRRWVAVRVDNNFYRRMHVSISGAQHDTSSFPHLRGMEVHIASSST